MSDETVVQDLKTYREFAQSYWTDKQTKYRLNERFYLGGEGQWDTQAVAARKSAMRPIHTYNRCPAIANQVTNDIRQNKPSIKVRGIDSSASAKTAEVMEGLIRQIEYRSNATAAYCYAVECAVRGGFGFFRIINEWENEESFNQELKIVRVKNPMAVLYDPRCQEFNGSDASEVCLVDQMNEDTFKRLYPNADIKSDKGIVEVTDYWQKVSNPRTLGMLSDGRVVELTAEVKKWLAEMPELQVIRERESSISTIKFSRIANNEVLERSDWDSEYIPVIPVWGRELIDADGRTTYKGLFDDAQDAMRSYNYVRTNIIEQIALSPKAPVVGTPQQFKGFEGEWDSANRIPKSRLNYNYQEGVPMPAPLQRPAPDAALYQEAMQCHQDIQYITGIHDAELGADSQEVSGRAILARQKKGSISTFDFVDNLRQAVAYAGRQLTILIPKFYDVPRLINAMGVDGQSKPILINGGAVTPDMPVINEARRLNAEILPEWAGKYDVVTETGPAYATQRQESSEAMLEMVQSKPELLDIIGDDLMSSFDFPGADNLARKFRLKMFFQNPIMLKKEDRQTIEQEVKEYQATQPQAQPDPSQVALQQLAEAQSRKAIADAGKSEASAVKTTMEAEQLRLELAVQSGALDSVLQERVMQILSNIAGSQPDVNSPVGGVNPMMMGA